MAWHTFGWRNRAAPKLRSFDRHFAQSEDGSNADGALSSNRSPKLGKALPLERDARPAKALDGSFRVLQSWQRRNGVVQHVYWVIERGLCGRPGPHKVPWDVAELKRLGITSVVALDGPIDTTALAEATIAVLPAYQPMIVLEREEQQVRFASQLPPILRFLDDCVRQGGAALVHCYHGWDRTGTVLACYLVAFHGLSADEAIATVRRVNLSAMTTTGYAEAVAAFERLANGPKFDEEPKGDSDGARYA
jgi:protein-tyrosine phosphatase